jgi:aspartate/methionine/tyrosine aminotransferase
MNEINLGWGNAVCVREAFLKGFPSRTIRYELDNYNLDYPPHEGYSELIWYTKNVLRRQLGQSYEHVFLVNGATGGTTIAMRAFAQKGYKTCLTRTPPFFPLYPHMIEAAGLKHEYGKSASKCESPIVLLDSPANPTGDIEEGVPWTATPMIWDAVYHSRVYTDGKHKSFGCDAVVGSYSKLLGLNSVRTGWIATNDDLLAERVKRLVTGEYCGMSGPSTHVLMELLRANQWKEEWWEKFETRARASLNDNRDQFVKLTKYFGDFYVPSYGMFYYAPMDQACKKLIQKAQVTWTSGSSTGTSDDFGRFNLGQDVKLVKEAVKRILKADRI